MSITLLVSSGASTTHSVVYQNEEGQWVTDLAYYSSFEKEVDGKTSDNAAQFQTEDFVNAGTYKVYSSLVIQGDCCTVVFLFVRNTFVELRVFALFSSFYR